MSSKSVRIRRSRSSNSVRASAAACSNRPRSIRSSRCARPRRSNSIRSSSPRQRKQRLRHRPPAHRKNRDPMTDHPARVLVVEDNEMNMQLVEYLLEEGGYQIVKAASGEDALSIARGGEAVDLILMDIHLPGIDGLSVIREMKSDPQTGSIPILALTAHAMRGDKDRFLEAGCDGYISKPIDVKTFLTSIRSYLRHKAV